MKKKYIVALVVGVLVVFGGGWAAAQVVDDGERDAYGTCVELDDGSLDCNLHIEAPSSSPDPSDPEECFDANDMVHFVSHDGVTVWYADDRGIGPYPFGFSASDGCIRKYEYWST